MEKECRYGLLQFVLTSKRYSLIEKSFFMLFFFAILFSIFLIIRTFWVNLELDIFGVILILILLIIGPKIIGKYSKKYNGSFSKTRTGKMFRANEKILKNNVGLGNAFVKSEISMAVMGVLYVLVIFLTLFIFLLFRINVEVFGVDLFFIFLVLEALVITFCVIKRINKNYKIPLQKESKIRREVNRIIPLKYRIIAWAVILLVFLLIIYRIFIIG